MVRINSVILHVHYWDSLLIYIMIFFCKRNDISARYLKYIFVKYAKRLTARTCSCSNIHRKLSYRRNADLRSNQWISLTPTQVTELGDVPSAIACPFQARRFLAMGNDTSLNPQPLGFCAK